MRGPCWALRRWCSWRSRCWPWPPGRWPAEEDTKYNLAYHGIPQAAKSRVLPRARGRDAIRRAARSRGNFGGDPVSAPQHLLSGAVPRREAHAEPDRGRVPQALRRNPHAAVGGQVHRGPGREAVSGRRTIRRGETGAAGELRGATHAAGDVRRKELRG